MNQLRAQLDRNRGKSVIGVDASAEAVTRFEESYLFASIGQVTGSGQASYPRAYN